MTHPRANNKKGRLGGTARALPLGDAPQRVNAENVEAFAAKAGVTEATHE